MTTTTRSTSCSWSTRASAYVNRINFRGNTKTEDQVLRREMRQMEGGWASTYLIDQSKTRLERLGFFKEVNVETRQCRAPTTRWT
jgi:outer membrane protein assembly factor BamA